MLLIEASKVDSHTKWAKDRSSLTLFNRTTLENYEKDTLKSKDQIYFSHRILLVIRTSVLLGAQLVRGF